MEPSSFVRGSLFSPNDARTWQLPHFGKKLLLYEKRVEAAEAGGQGFGYCGHKPFFQKVMYTTAGPGYA
jgi:hypothetical protein